MDGSEKLTEPGDSWFSSKCFLEQPRDIQQGVELLFRQGGLLGLPSPDKLRIPALKSHGSETVTAKCHRREGNSPDRLLRSPISVKYNKGSAIA